jgi:hypothetical protein
MKMYCPVCNSELKYKLCVPPNKTKIVRCDYCKVRMSLPIGLFNQIIGRREEICA